MKFLVVDDDEVFRDALATVLVEQGNDAEMAPSVRRALEFLERDAYDAVFTDLKMPRQGGLELLAQVRARWPRTLVIMVTGFATVSNAVEAMKLGAFDYLAKPFGIDQVRRMLVLISEQQKFRNPPVLATDASALASDLARRSGSPILLVGGESRHVGRGVIHVPFDPSKPSELSHLLNTFLVEHPQGGMVVAQADRLLADHRLEDIVEILQDLRQRLEGRGPLGVGLDPTNLTQADAEAIRTAVAAPAVQRALEALSNPIRRRVLFRLSQGPASFSETMHAAEVEDSPKFSFHLHRLHDEGLIVRSGEAYEITPKGRDAVEILHDMESVVALEGQPVTLYSEPGKQPPSSRPGRSSRPSKAPRPRR